MPLPVLDQIRPSLMYVWDRASLSAVLWDGTLTAQGLTIGSVGITDGFNLGVFDFVALGQATLTDTYTFRRGGSSGNLVGTIVILYTDSTKATLSTVTKTPVT